MEACVLLSKTMVLQTCIYTTQSQHMSPQIAWVLARVSNKHIVHERVPPPHNSSRTSLSMHRPHPHSRPAPHPSCG